MGFHFCKRLVDALYQVVGQADQEKAHCWSCLDSNEIQENMDLKCWKWNAAAWWLSNFISAVAISDWKRISSEPRLLEIRDWPAEIFKWKRGEVRDTFHVWKVVSGIPMSQKKNPKTSQTPNKKKSHSKPNDAKNLHWSKDLIYG